MKTLFVDSGYWVAILNPTDDLHARAKAVAATIRGAVLVTSEPVLTEVLDFFASFGTRFRRQAVGLVRRLRAEPNVMVVAQTSRLFDGALELYARREDKEWGLTDCASFVIMEERGITEALAHDHHFAQAGFQALLRDQE